MEIYFARHGEAECNLTWEFDNSDDGCPLTPQGKQQAAALAAQLAAAGISHIYASPILRARQTAQVMAETLGADYDTSGALLEFSVGVLEGRRDAAAWDIFKAMIDTWFVSGNWGAAIEGGESLNDMRRRFLPFVGKIKQLHAGTGPVLVISHGGLYRCVLPFLLCNVDFAFVMNHPIGNAGYILASDETGMWRARSWCGEEMD